MSAETDVSPSTVTVQVVLEDSVSLHAPPQVTCVLSPAGIAVASNVSDVPFGYESLHSAEQTCCSGP